MVIFKKYFSASSLKYKIKIQKNDGHFAILTRAVGELHKSGCHCCVVILSLLFEVISIAST